METLSPPSGSKDAGNGTTAPSGAEPPTTGRSRAVGGSESGGVWFGAVLAVVALVFAAVALVFDDGGGGGGASGGGADTATIELTEFALSPSALTVSAGSALEVVNAGSVAHNLSIGGTDIATADLAGGESETLDLSSLAPGEYEIICTIAGHADSGMTGTLTVTEGGAGAASLAGGEAASGDAAAGDHASHGGTMTEADYQAMTDAMNASMSEFPAETEGTGNQILEPEVKADGTKVFELTAQITPWELEPGKFVDAWTYNGTVPGPRMHVEVGDRVEVVLNNDLPMATDLHIHGINLPNEMDGVAPYTQNVIEPGESFTYAFTTDEVAVAMYHPHHHGQKKMPDGMVGTMFVGDVALPTGQTVSGYPIPDDLEIAQEMPMVVNDSGVIGYALNGKSFPATEPITAKQGDWVLFHYFNHGNQIHPMHLHQFDQIVVAKDGYKVDSPYVADTVNVAPGERYSVLVKLDKPGTWVWHCHILNHVESEEGMFGMVTAVIVE
ncbi:MAG: multicopper oxidase domain-containing protein [Acidimicrobiales bacterium]|nr:multicopper oxidase domain-containing protein [Acidimicrobiales bacterium]